MPSTEIEVELDSTLLKSTSPLKAKVVNLNMVLSAQSIASQCYQLNRYLNRNNCTQSDHSNAGKPRPVRLNNRQDGGLIPTMAVVSNPFPPFAPPLQLARPPPSHRERETKSSPLSFAANYLI
ncbi:hypothetical protein Trydic_g12686 [Trypoxylus dichotomus]